MERNDSRGDAMNSCLKYLLAGLLALLTQAAFAQATDLGAASDFAVLSAAPDHGGAVTCTRSSIDGDVGSSGFEASVTQTICTITGTVIAPVSANVVKDFNDAYDALAGQSCDSVLTGTLAGVTLTPGTYCFDAAATLTGTLTLVGSSTDTWLFKIGTLAPGALTGTNFSVAMEGGAEACNVTWWVDAAATMTDSEFKGTILAGAAITMTGTAPGTPAEGRALAKAAVTLTDVAFLGCEAGGRGGKSQSKCNQGVGNGPENCDPGNSNQDGHGSNPFVGSPRTNDELGGTPGNPGRQGGNNK
ncbi:MAG TPA: ice-binding family protein [Burkholderiales bacterium]|nr:ice-binding family protein [Burkholderiales bacterium]